MSLIRLLTTTRSLSDVKNEPSPYRMTEQGLLPKFGPKKQAEAAREVAREDARPPGEKENLGEGNRDRTDAGCSLKFGSSRKPTGNAERGTRNTESGWLRGWWQRLFARKRRRESRGPVQPELALDMIQVVRNDLSDTEETRNAERGVRNKEKPRVAEAKPAEESVFGASRG